MPLPRMYTEFARYWPLISAPADYAAEARHWAKALRDRLGPGRHEILELGVGGGNNLSHLTAEFSATAVDLSPAMLEQCRRLNPTVPVQVGDMRTVRLGRTFRAVLIHDAITYMLSEGDLAAAFATAAAHLAPGGLFITTPDFTTETFRDPAIRSGTNTRGDVSFTSFDYTWDPDPADTTIETLMWYLIREGRTVRTATDSHIQGLFPQATWLRLLAAAGFSVELVPYDVHDDHHPAWLFVGTLGGRTPAGRAP